MTKWTAEELHVLDRAAEIHVAGQRDDGYRGAIRHQKGAISWDHGVRDVAYVPDATQGAAIDAAYARKYGTGSATQAITAPRATTTTLRVEPR